MTLIELKAKWLKANEAYFNKKAIMSDAAFNALTDELENRAPKWLAAQGTGAKVDKKTEVRLDEFMPSLTKVYPEKIATKIRSTTELQVVMDKLDGSALQVVYDQGKPIKVVTRGNGTLGGDISFLIPYLNLPKTINRKVRVVLRCEAVMKASVFKKKYSEEAENARALVNGALNRMKPSPALKDIDIVVLGVYGSMLEAGLNWAAERKFTVVPYEVMPLAKAVTILAARRKLSAYDMDGLVLAGRSAVFEYANADKPKWTWAFKENESIDDAAKATVKQIIWQESRKHLLVPKIEIEPIRLGGTTVTFATAHNAQWMVDRGIGPGAIVQIVRSGDVIPKIVGVVKKGKLQLPDFDYVQRGVHFVSASDSKEQAVRAIHHFFTTLGIEFIASKTIEKLYDTGFTNVMNHLEAYSDKTKHRAKIVGPGLGSGVTMTGGMRKYNKAGLGFAMCAKIFGEMNRVFDDGVLLRDLMVASNKMNAGIGERKLKAIEAHYKDVPNILAELVKGNEAFVRMRMAKVPGFKKRTIDMLIDSLVDFRPWLRHSLKFIKVRKPEIVQAKKAVKGKLSGERISFTGYRSAEEEEWVIKNGGIVIDFGSKTTILLFRPTGKASTKVTKAQAKGIRTLLFRDLK